jgi:hypothetical protein
VAKFALIEDSFALGRVARAACGKSACDKNGTEPERHGLSSFASSRLADSEEETPL